MNRTYPNTEETRFSTKPERSAIRTGDFELDDRTMRADEEEEMLATLWAADPGNQGG